MFAWEARLLPSQIPIAGMIGDEHLALAHMVGGADDAFVFHAFDEACRPVISYLKLALDIAGRGFLVSRDDGDGRPGSAALR